jgi:prevent-host-death family protein
MRTIPQRELRNNIGQVLREVEAGERVRITVAGRPVADLVPIDRGPPWRFAPAAEVDRILREAPLDREFMRDLEDAFDQTIDIPGVDDDE